MGARPIPALDRPPGGRGRHPAPLLPRRHPQQTPDRTHPVVCHHDPGPNNTVFTNDIPTAFIDFDTAAPGDPLEELGYMAWTWCISSKPSAPPATVQAAQVRVLADAYGLDATSRHRLIEAALDRQARNARWWHSHLAGPFPHVADDHTIARRIKWSEQEHAYTSANRKTFDTALG
ncbi:aminoglycoside phosphotransferase family protein [Streptomyces sp. NPDC048309]|uniref:phosphotransferase family protein n=1 Tax=Streptomyces sp. NPDC048309 TaxID=3154618 RepID=UPI0033EAF317